MLRGAHSISLDQKGRIAIPTKYREAINEQCGGRFVCTIDIQNPCLLLFPLNNWEKLSIFATAFERQESCKARKALQDCPCI